jgi:Protein of unknown function (DUF2934)
MAQPIEQSLESEPQTTVHPTNEEIELRAYQIYIERGGAHGQDVEDWLQAESELAEKYGKRSEFALLSKRDQQVSEFEVLLR